MPPYSWYYRGQTTSTGLFMHCVYDLLINYILISASALTLTSCSYNISMVHTEGQASDVIDETTTQTPDISPTLTIPAGSL